MKILITGAKGFIGKNLTATLDNIRTRKDKSFGICENLVLYKYDTDSCPASLDSYCKDCDFVFHLAGVNRPKKQDEFMTGNFGFTSVLLDTLKKHGNYCPVMISSSIQATLNNLYGQSKKAGEELLFSYQKETQAQVYVYRYPNIFGKWCRPNYNSVVATFCYNITHGLSVQVNDPSTIMKLVYIDDVVAELIALLKNAGHKNEAGYYYVPTAYTITLGEIIDLLYSFRDSRKTNQIPDMTDNSFVKKLYSTYLSYLPQSQFSYPLKMNSDNRGSFTEILRTAGSGQFSVNIIKPGITKGEHWHHTKNEKFAVVSGNALIQLRNIYSDNIIEYRVNSKTMEVVDIPPGYTHNLINEGDTDLIILIWSNECFDPLKPDTYFLKVNMDRESGVT